MAEDNRLCSHAGSCEQNLIDHSGAFCANLPKASMTPSKTLSPELTEMCDACNGSGFGVADTYCGKCGGAGGYPMNTRPPIPGTGQESGAFDPKRIAALADYMRRNAKSASEASRMMAQAKSLRQGGHNPPRDDLYMWPEPEQTVEWEIADILAAIATEAQRAETVQQGGESVVRRELCEEGR
jgi:hypothetical protein